MTSLTLISALAGVFVALMVWLAYQYYWEDQPRRRLVNRRLRMLEENDNDRVHVLEALRRERVFYEGNNSRIRDVWDYVMQSGVMERKNIALSVLGACYAVSFLVTFFVTKEALSSGLLALIWALFSVAVLIRFLRSRRVDKFNGQLKDALEIMVRSLKAGHPMPTSLNLVSREMSDPAGSEFGLLADELSFGADLSVALRNMYRRIGDPEINFFATAVLIQSQTGGNLAELLARLSQLIRSREKLRRKVKSLTAEGRISALFLTVLPPLMVFIIWIQVPTYYTDVWDDERFKNAMIVGTVMLVIGNVIMRRMTSFRY